MHDETAATATLSDRAGGCAVRNYGEIHPYPSNWLNDPGREPCNLYASKLNRMISASSHERTAAVNDANSYKKAQCRSASKSQVQLVHTFSIYGQVDMPICELNRIYGLNLTAMSKKQQVKRRMYKREDNMYHVIK